MLSWIHIQSIRDYKKTTQAVIFCFAVVFLFFLAPDVFAQSADTLGIEALEETDLALARTDFITIVARVINVILGLLGIIVVGYFIYAGFLIMTSGGEEDKIAKGKRVMINATIGLAIVLSSWGIATFIIRALSDATGTGSKRQTASVRGPSLDSFYISGSLGTIIDDHYPERNQQDVVRNTSILITFAEPIDPSTVIRNTNNSCWREGEATTDNCPLDADGNILDPYYGDCQPGENGTQVCDTLITQSIKITPVLENTEEEVSVVVADAMAVPQDGDLRHYYTFSLRPGRYLDASQEYLVEVIGGDTNDDGFGIRKKKTEGNIEGEDPFASSYRGFYSWNFTTGDTLDFSPPTVVRVSPAKRDADDPNETIETIPKNRVVSITFSEPMDPTLVQGRNGQGSSFHHIRINTTENVPGEWKVSNGYKTVEFFSSDPCGENSCGEVMYCLPAEGGNLFSYIVLIRAAHANIGSEIAWDSIYGTGVADLAGNLLDGDADGVEQATEDAAGVVRTVQPFDQIKAAEKVADNYHWSFFVEDRIDREPPSISEISPDIDGENTESTDLSLTFNTNILARSISEIDLLVQDGVFDDQEDYNPGESARIISQEDEVTSVRVRPASDLKKPDLGDDQSIYYFIQTPHTLQNNNQQCFYPGLGPKRMGVGTTICDPDFDNGVLVDGANCVIVPGYDQNTDTGCPYDDQGSHVTKNTTDCLEIFENDISDRNR